MLYIKIPLRYLKDNEADKDKFLMVLRKEYFLQGYAVADSDLEKVTIENEKVCTICSEII
jgi:hypothetical protein